ncbi:hypothetical protein RJ639_012299, partial [Escallonia herrerae]
DPFAGRYKMASSSSQGLRANRIYRRWLAETFDGHEAAEEELSDSLNGNDGIVQPSVQTLPLSLEPLEPYVGMEFESAEDARDFYEMYGRRVGFTIRNNRTRRSLKDNSIIGREFVCSKEGFCPEKPRRRENRRPTSQRATREGCSAMVRIAAKGGGKWVIYGFAKEHSHDLNPSKIPQQRSHRIAFCERLLEALPNGVIAKLISLVGIYTSRCWWRTVVVCELISDRGAVGQCDCFDAAGTNVGLLEEVVVFKIGGIKMVARGELGGNGDGYHRDGSGGLGSDICASTATLVVEMERGGLTYHCLQDEKDLKIRELSTELHRERKRSAIYEEQLQLILKYVEEHTQKLSLKVEIVFENVRELESEEQDDADSD